MSEHRTQILLLEDNPALAASIEFALSTYGLKVIGPFHTNEEGLAAIDAENVHVAILDLDLGHETSIATAERLRRAGVPFLFMSGHELDEQVPETYQNEVFLPKPIDPETLVESIEELLKPGNGPLTD